jgi:predicted nuclease of predicted toxin-antitoxin system
MKFLIDEDLPRSTAAVIQEFGYEAVDVRDVHLRGAPDEQIAAYAKANGLCLVTADGGFANIRQYPPVEYSGLVVLELPPRANLPVILRLVREFFSNTEIVCELSGKLAVVAFGRVRIRER